MSLMIKCQRILAEGCGFESHDGRLVLHEFGAWVPTMQESSFGRCPDVIRLVQMKTVVFRQPAEVPSHHLACRLHACSHTMHPTGKVIDSVHIDTLSPFSALHSHLLHHQYHIHSLPIAHHLRPQPSSPCHDSSAVSATRSP